MATIRESLESIERMKRLNPNASIRDQLRYIEESRQFQENQKRIRAQQGGLPMDQVDPAAFEPTSTMQQFGRQIADIPNSIAENIRKSGFVRGVGVLSELQPQDYLTMAKGAMDPMQSAATALATTDGGGGERFIAGHEKSANIADAVRAKETPSALDRTVDPISPFVGNMVGNAPLMVIVPEVSAGALGGRAAAWVASKGGQAVLQAAARLAVRTGKNLPVDVLQGAMISALDGGGLTPGSVSTDAAAALVLRTALGMVGLRGKGATAADGVAATGGKAPKVLGVVDDAGAIAAKADDVAPTPRVDAPVPETPAVTPKPKLTAQQVLELQKKQQRANVSDDVNFIEDAPNAPGMARSADEGVKVARGEQEVISDADIQRAAEEDASVGSAGTIAHGARQLGVTAPTAHEALKTTGPVGRHAEKLLYDTELEHAQRIAAVRRYVKKNVEKLTPEQQNLVIDKLDRGTLSPEMEVRFANSPEVKQVFTDLRRMFKIVDDEATKLALPKIVDGEKVAYYGRANYFPHLDVGLSKQVQETVGMTPEQVKAWYGGKELDDILDATQKTKLEQFKIQNAKARKAGTKSSNLMFQRSEDADFNRNLPEVLDRYFDRTFRQIAEAKRFGTNAEDGIKEIVRKATDFGEDAEAIQQNLTLALKGIPDNDSFVGKAANAAIGFESAVRLPFAVVGQINQIGNTIAKAGLGRTAKAIVNLAKPLVGLDGSTLKATQRAAVTAHDMAAAVTEGRTGWLAKFGQMQLKATGFTAEDAALRYVSGAAGVNYADDLLETVRRGSPSWGERLTGQFGSNEAIVKQAMKELREMRVDVDAALKTGKLSDIDHARAAHWFSRKTQFGTGRADIPYLWKSHPALSVVTLFKKWSISQGHLLAREVVAPALKGDIRPLVRWLAVTPVVGEGANLIMDGLLNRDRSEETMQARILNAYAAGTFSWVYHMARGMAENKLSGLAPTFKTMYEAGRFGMAPVNAAYKDLMTDEDGNFGEYLDEWRETPEGDGPLWDLVKGTSRLGKAAHGHLYNDEGLHDPLLD